MCKDHLRTYNLVAKIFFLNKNSSLCYYVTVCFNRFKDFCRYILSYEHASIYRDRSSGCLRGMSFLDVQPKTLYAATDDDKPYHYRIVKV